MVRVKGVSSYPGFELTGLYCTQIFHEDVAIDEIINNKIAGSEVKKTIRKLKNDKSAGEDNILNEVLKTGKSCSVDPIVKLMNLIFESEKYPLKWTRNSQITEGGLTDKPDNYRDIHQFMSF